ncbi:hypothetical protein [Palaeococcus pacificus]|uniref:hypothetical protein n=1 Tax=Palaeococcus pacificus TaxID=971279 RepID=UPI00064FE9FB|nr:hypothetical protein [Palaeococcus pacificus]
MLLEENVLEWLVQGTDDAKDIVDLPWNLKRVKENYYVAEHPKMPFLLNIVFSDTFVHLIVSTGIETASLDSKERLKMYRVLLLLNEKINLMKFTLSGINEEIIIRVDLDRNSLGKAEFNDALTALLIGLNEMVAALNLEEEFQETVFERIALMILDRLSKGASEGDIITFLVEKVGLDRKEAEMLLEEVIKSKSETGVSMDYI